MSDERFWIWRRRGPYNDGIWRLQTDEALLDKVLADPEHFEVEEVVPLSHLSTDTECSECCRLAGHEQTCAALVAPRERQADDR